MPSSKDMQYVRLGKSGLKVSRRAVGCAGFGLDWMIGEEDALPMIKKCYDAGLNFFDTAARIESQTYFEAVERSLSNLQLDYVDLYQIHRFDPVTPIEETMEALHDLVKSGKVRYIGASSMWAWQLAKMNYVAGKNGWTKFITMQNQYNLLYREAERELNPYCLDASIGLIPWAPLAGGKLMGRNRNTARSQTVTKFYGDFTDEDDVVIARVAEVAKKKGIPASQVGLAWLLSKPAVSAPIVDISKDHHLTDAIAALSVTLMDEEIKYMEEPYKPKRTNGHL